MRKKVLVLLAEGFEELEVVAPVDVLRRGDVQVDVASVESRLEVKGRNQMTLTADGYFSPLNFDYQLVLVPGGSGGVERLKQLPKVLDFLKQWFESGKPTAAICAAPAVLAAAGVLKECTVTSHPGVRSELLQVVKAYREENVVWDGHLATSRGAGTALEFGLSLVEFLCGKTCALEVADQIVYSYYHPKGGSGSSID